MKIQVGKKYRTRGGYVAEITGKYRFGKKDYPYPFEGLVRGTNRSWTEDGRYTLCEYTDFDLIEEIPPTPSDYQELFNFFAEKHNLILIQTEMDEIVGAVKKHLGL